MTPTTLKTQTHANGVHYTLDNGTLVAIGSYHAVGMYDVTFSAVVKDCGMRAPSDLFRLCLGLEAAEYYVLAVASEYRRWINDKD